MRTIYAVSSGCYPDYSVHCLCESREKAEAIVAQMAELDEPRVEELALLADGDDVQPVKAYSAETVNGEPYGRGNGTEYEVRPWELPVHEVFRVKHPVGTFYPDGSVVALCTNFRSYEAALKTCRDLTKQFLALEPPADQRARAGEGE